MAPELPPGWKQKWNRTNQHHFLRLPVVDNLQNSSTILPLSADQGRILKELVDSKISKTEALEKIKTLDDKITALGGWKVSYAKYKILLNWGTEASAQITGATFNPENDFFSYNIVWDAEDDVVIKIENNKIVCTATRPSKAKCYVLLTRTNFTI